jgi:hypothetical protein
METRSSDRTGIMVVRVWIESNARGGFRARLTHTLDSTAHEAEIAAAADPEDIYAVVRSWVEAFVDQDRVGGRNGVRAGDKADPVTLA